jgi:hypothetical protein
MFNLIKLNHERPTTYVMFDIVHYPRVCWTLANATFRMIDVIIVAFCYMLQ